MDSSQERRRHSRSEVTWPVTIGSTETIISGRTKNISSGGAFINCKTTLSPGEVFDMVIHIQSQPTSLTGKAEVVWMSQHGIGVKFYPERMAESRGSKK
jgi:Tfp pilus assembly protein PilZ